MCLQASKNQAHKGEYQELKTRDSQLIITSFTVSCREQVSNHKGTHLLFVVSEVLVDWFN